LGSKGFKFGSFVGCPNKKKKPPRSQLGAFGYGKGAVGRVFGPKVGGGQTIGAS